jgi:hypothetical protein
MLRRRVADLEFVVSCQPFMFQFRVKLVPWMIFDIREIVLKRILALVEVMLNFKLLYLIYDTVGLEVLLIS